jgi:lysophosphatidylcholine acyltransferase/lyso-PAF acetyltransferase
MNIAFACDERFKQAPLMGSLAMMIDAIFVPLGGNDQARQRIIDIINERQDAIEKTAKYSPLIVFPEGTTTNGTHLLRFKKGAFVALKRIQPLVLKFECHGSLCPAYDVIELLPLFIMELSWSCLKCQVLKLPEIYPTEHLFSRPEA